MDPVKLTTSPRGLAFIEGEEKFEALPYIAPEGNETDGFGHVITAADRAAHRFDHKLLEPEAEAVLRQDLAPIELFVNAVLPGKLTQCQFDAVVSFCENTGLGNFENSTMFRLIKAGDMLAAAEQFPRWDHMLDPKTRTLIREPGLTKRRAGERLMFLGLATP